MIGIEFGEKACGCEADARGPSGNYYGLGGAFEVVEGRGIGLEERGHVAGTVKDSD